MLRPILLRALRRGKRRGPGGLPYDPVLKFKVLVLQGGFHRKVQHPQAKRILTFLPSSLRMAWKGVM